MSLNPWETDDGAVDGWHFDHREPDPEDLDDTPADADLRNPALWQDSNPWREPIGLQPPGDHLWAPPPPIGAAVLGDSVQQP